MKEITPTVGFQVEEFSQNNIHFTVYDMSGISFSFDVFKVYPNIFTPICNTLI